MSLLAMGSASVCWGQPSVVEVDRINAAPANPLFVFPPDTMGAIGRNDRFVDLVNTGYSPVRHEQPRAHRQHLSLEQFWDTAFTNTFNNPPPGGTAPHLVKADPLVFDPRILYDDNTQRWYAVSAANRESSNSLVYVGALAANRLLLRGSQGQVPEPATLALCLLALAALCLRRATRSALV